jgi:hypothetical protein
MAERKFAEEGIIVDGERLTDARAPMRSRRMCWLRCGPATHSSARSAAAIAEVLFPGLGRSVRACARSNRVATEQHQSNLRRQ